MSYPKDLREKLCMAQRPFAILIGCHESQLSMAEAGLRNLPSTCNQLLAALEEAVETMNRSSSSDLPNTDTTIKWLNRQKRKHETSKQLLLLEKEKLDRQILDCQQWLQAAAPLEGNPLFMGSNSIGLQFRLSKRKAMLKQNRLQLSWAKLQMEIAILDAAIAQAEALLQT